MDGLAADKVEGEMMFDFLVTFAGIRCEIFFGEDRARFGLFHELFQSLKRFAVANDKIRVACPQVIVKGVQAFVKEVLSAWGLGVKDRVEDKDRDDRTSLESGMERCVICQP
jgi:hypothetical protein